ncbi:MAG: aspartate 1-decarboxylase [Acidobacteria bacterium]|nr:aspartate 1-decarboxylase [Acidobacteriota bacterium]
MLVKVLKSKIHRATVTAVDTDYEGSITIDADLLDAADLQTHEAVQVWNVKTGDRLETYVLPGKRGSGEVCLNGAAARRAQPGDLVILAAFAWLDRDKAAQTIPAIVKVDEANRPAGKRSREKPQPIR